MDPSTITIGQWMQTLGSLGTFGVVIWLYVKEKGDSKTLIKEKNNYIRELNDKVLAAFEKNATVNTQLSATIKENTKATQSLTERVTDVLIGRNNK